MAKSQKVTVTEDSAGVASVTTKDAEILDIVTTAISTESAVTGMYGLVQRGAFFIGGMALNNKLKSGSVNFLK